MVSAIADDTLIMFVGDTHGHIAHWRYILDEAKCFPTRVRHFVQVGDFGYWEHNLHEDDYADLIAEGMPVQTLAADWIGAAYLDALSELMVDNDSIVYWIDGNHENHVMLRTLYGPGGKFYKSAGSGFWEIRPNVIYIPRATAWIWGDTKFLAMGGAYSVDAKTGYAKDEFTGEDLIGRIEEMEGCRDGMAFGTVSKRLTHGISYHWENWWAEETITEDELAKAMAIGKVDVVVAHDCPESVDIAGRHLAITKTDDFLKTDMDSQASRVMCERLLTSARPAHWIHGHYHLRYTAGLDLGDDALCRVIGLSRDETGRESYVVATPEELRDPRSRIG